MNPPYHHHYQSGRSSFTYFDDNNQIIKLATNSINDNNKKQFNAKYKKIGPEGTLEKNFNNEEQLNQFLGNNVNGKYIVDNSRVKKKKVKKSKSIKKKRRRSRKKIF